MKIMKASAGSGKTYQLSQKYRKMLLDSGLPDPYRHILAVTFTNKATDEMKARILKDLSESAQNDKKARKILIKLLHDYSSFSVCTIDKFFQQTLKAFSREIGQFSDYQIELDRNSLIKEAMDRILDSLTEDRKELIEWIKDSVKETLEKGDKVKLEDGLYYIGQRLKSEEHRSAAEKYDFDDKKEFDPKRILAIKKESSAIIRRFEQAAKEAGVPFDGGKVKPLTATLRKKNPDWAEYYDASIKDYNTALILKSVVFNLGLAGEFYKQFSSLLKEKNVMCLDESNNILKGIIDGSDAPFVYEKTGVRYDHFLLDEFQDTSNIQWDNFYPLLKESDSHGNDNLIVGDVKQSIYRWRESDWDLLDHTVGDCFKNAEVESLKENWRSTLGVINFNNALFEWLSNELGLAKTVYSDVKQTQAKAQSQEGYVKVEFRDDQLDAVLESVKAARDAGAEFGEIGIIVRTNSDGSDIAAHLIKEGIPVVSDDSLKVKSSIVVRKLVSLLSAMENPDDTLNRYLVKSMAVEFPQTYHSIVDLCEYFIRVLKENDPASFKEQYLYVQSFMDFLHGWSVTNGNNIRDFLAWWDDNDPFISSPQGSNSVRVMTIHKSKGLEFPYTIVPFVNKIDLFRPTDRWCWLDTKGTAFSEELSGLYPVKLSGSSELSYFDKDYLQERQMQVIDNMNVLYVAFTRAGKCLHIISKSVPNTCKESVGKEKKKYSDFSQLLYHFLGGFETVEYGKMLDFVKYHEELKKEKEENDKASRKHRFEASYESIDPAGRLKASEEAFDFFSEDGLAGAQASPRINGIVLHEILSRISVPGDLDKSIEISVADGLLNAEDVENTRSLLASAIASHPDWYDGSKSENEVSIIGLDGKEHRPDKVILRENGSVDIIDYKFGIARRKYINQVKDYMDLYRKMGYSDVRGWVWMVRNSETIII